MIADMSAETGIDGLLVLHERSGRDGRGVVREFYRRSELADAESSPPGHRGGTEVTRGQRGLAW
jgi:dTDP-4-dehydrorhamnose 3,5-epimerase-like enzyme